MKEMTVFNNPDFGEIRAVEVNGEPWLVGKDVAAALGYERPTDAARKHVDDEDRGVAKIETPSGMQEMTIINESGLYSLVLSSKLPSAKKFRRWVTSEVLPSIRRTGSYSLPQDYLSALRALADAEEKRLALEAENEIQRQTIADFQPMKQYIDSILSSDEAMDITQIAADYDMSAKKLNKILHSAGIQRKVNNQWILYQSYMGKGYTKSVTYTFQHSDGRPGARPHTKWTQKGRLLIHKILTDRGITALMDKTAAS